MLINKMKLLWLNQPAYLSLYAAFWYRRQNVFICCYRTAGTLPLSIYSISHSFSMPPLLPMRCSALGGLQSSWDGMISLSTSGCVVLNLPARPADKPQWWIRGVTIQSLAYLLQCSSLFMWSLCICVQVVWCACVFLGREDGSHIGSVGVWGEWVFFEELWLEREIISGSRKPNSRDRGRSRVGQSWERQMEGERAQRLK